MIELPYQGHYTSRVNGEEITVYSCEAMDRDDLPIGSKVKIGDVVITVFVREHNANGVVGIGMRR